MEKKIETLNALEKLGLGPDVLQLLLKSGTRKQSVPIVDFPDDDDDGTPIGHDSGQEEENNESSERFSSDSEGDDSDYESAATSSSRGGAIARGGRGGGKRKAPATAKEKSNAKKKRGSQKEKKKKKTRTVEEKLAEKNQRDRDSLEIVKSLQKTLGAVTGQPGFTPLALESLKDVSQSLVCNSTMNSACEDLEGDTSSSPTHRVGANKSKKPKSLETEKVTEQNRSKPDDVDMALERVLPVRTSRRNAGESLSFGSDVDSELLRDVLDSITAEQNAAFARVGKNEPLEIPLLARLGHNSLSAAGKVQYGTETPVGIIENLVAMYKLLAQLVQVVNQLVESNQIASRCLDRKLSKGLEKVKSDYHEAIANLIDSSPDARLVISVPERQLIYDRTPIIVKVPNLSVDGVTVLKKVEIDLMKRDWLGVTVWTVAQEMVSFVFGGGDKIKAGKVLSNFSFATKQRPKRRKLPDGTVITYAQLPPGIFKGLGEATVRLMSNPDNPKQKRAAEIAANSAINQFVYGYRRVSGVDDILEKKKQNCQLKIKDVSQLTSPSPPSAEERLRSNKSPRKSVSPKKRRPHKTRAERIAKKIDYTDFHIDPQDLIVSEEVTVPATGQGATRYSVSDDDAVLDAHGVF